MNQALIERELLQNLTESYRSIVGVEVDGIPVFTEAESESIQSLIATAVPRKKLSDKQKLMQALQNGDSATALTILNKPKRVRIREVDGNAKTVRQYINTMRKKVFDPFDLRELAKLADYVNEVVAEAVVELKKNYSWKDIGEGIGLSYPGCREKFGGYSKVRSERNKKKRLESKQESEMDRGLSNE